MKTKITIGEKYGPAMEITDQAAADAYFEECVKHHLKFRRAPDLPPFRAEAERIERMNLGYYAGYCSDETRGRVERLFNCAHPIFGSIAANGAPTAKEAFAAGMIAAKSGIKEAAKMFTPATKLYACCKVKITKPKF